MTGDGRADPGDRPRGLDELVRAARAHPHEPQGARDRLMTRIRTEAAIASGRRRTLRQGWGWWIHPRAVPVRPAAAAAAGVALVALVVAAWWAGGVRGAEVGPRGTVQFVLVAPGASSVTLVGDFNEWEAEATPLRRTAPNGLWSVDVKLDPGRHAYAFVVDDVWIPDAFAPRAPDSEFGSPASVVVVTEERRS